MKINELDKALKVRTLISRVPEKYKESEINKLPKLELNIEVP